MNQDEDVPTRVTRGALRRRSVDQEATPQKPTGAAVGGTPKKTNSTKRVTALNAIQESESGRPSTPIVGRTSRRRMSETIDTPTSLPNKFIQNLKESSSTETGRRSRNTSLTEENLNELNATYEGSSTTLTTRSRTPARLRASHEALVSSGSPQPAVTGVRRSTRRNSVTSDDGNSSVQSLPVTSSKLGPSVRPLKDDTIIEEDDRDDRAESVSSDTSTRQTRAQSAFSTLSVSAVSSPASPVLGAKPDSTPPHVSRMPRVAITPLSLSKLSPRSKNVSFSEDSKLVDHQSSLPKTPTSASKEMFVVVEDLRNSELKGASPRVAATVSASPKMALDSEKKNKSINASPKRDHNHSDNLPLSKLVKSASKDKMNDSTTSMIAAKDEECAEGAINVNDVSGIEVLNSSVKHTTETAVIEVNDSVNDIDRTANQSLSEGNKFSNSWSQSVRRSATKGIDEYSVRKQEEQERLEEEKQTVQKASLDSSKKTRSPATKQRSAELSEQEEDTSEENGVEEEEAQQRNEFLDDEALEMEDYQSCDSIDSDLRREMDENEIPEQGEDLGSEDTDENDEPEDDEDGNDSWIVSDGDEIEPMEEDELLQSSGEEETPTAVADDTGSELQQPKKASRRRRILDSTMDDSDEEENDTPTAAKSPKRNTSDIRRSATPALKGENDHLTPTKKPNASESKAIFNSVEKNTSYTKTTPMETPGFGEEMQSTLRVPTTPIVGKKSPKKVDLKSPSPVATVTAQEAASVEGKETQDQDCSAVMFEQVDMKEETDEQKASGESKETQDQDCSAVMFGQVDMQEEKDEQNGNEDMENGDTSALSSSQSPKKTIIARKSLPANAASITKPKAVDTGVRKSLPASTKLLTANEKNDANEAEDEQPEPKWNNGSVEEIVDLEEKSEVEPSPSPDEKKSQNASLAMEVSLDQPANDVYHTGRKSMPPVSIISAQFYIGAAKKRNTIGVGDINGPTSSTPKQSASTEKNKSSVVPNPFALEKGAKLKSRVSLVSNEVSAIGQQQQQSPKKPRLSMPPKLIEKDSQSTTEPASQQPEPMEVDEVPEKENVVNREEANAQTGGETTEDDDGDDSVQEVQSDVKQRSKVPKPAKAKALEDYDLANILDRCNEFVRGDKERKKQLASVLRKKKEEKKKQRELEKQQELEAAKNAAPDASGADKDVSNNSTNASTGNDSTGQGEESLKKKKKRKPKKVNYLLEELAETKKDRLEQALRRKLEVIEGRKQRKKERLIEKKKQQDKENGNGGVDKVPTTAASGIGAKLEKIKKNKKAAKQEKEPSVRVALSAFAVFHQNPSNQIELPLTSVAAEDGKQTKSDQSPAKKKQQLNATATELATKSKKPVDSDEKATIEILYAKKKQTLATQPKEAMVDASNERDTLSMDTEKILKKQKKKQATTKKISNGESEHRNEIVKEMAETVDEGATTMVKNPKEKKIKEQMTELVSNEADSSTVPKQKKSKKIKRNEAAEEMLSIDEELRAEGETMTVSKAKKGNKQLASQKIFGVQEEPSSEPTADVSAKKRKREQQGDNNSVVSTPRPAKHTKLRVLQRIESGSFFEESVTPDKLRMKRNFGFDERQATPAKQLGFRVSSLLPTGQDELRSMATSSKKITKDGRKPSKFGDVIATERNASLPLPVWTSSGVFLESAIDGNGDSDKKKAQKSKPNSSTAAESGFIQLKTQGKGDFSLKKLRSGPNAETPHRVDPATIAQSVLNFKRQQLLEKTAHLRDKKKSHRV